MACFAVIHSKDTEQRFDVTDNHNLLDEYLYKEYGDYFTPEKVTQKEDISKETKKEITNLKRQRTIQSKEIDTKVNDLKQEIATLQSTPTKAKRNNKKIEGLKSQIIDLEKQRVNLIEEYDKKISEVGKQPSPVTEQVGNDSSVVELENDGKADAPTKESVNERLNIKHPFYKKVSDALDKLGLIKKYNPETKEGDVIGGYVQSDSKGGFASGDMYFKADGSISYIKDGVIVEFDKNGNVISENTKQAASEKLQSDIDGIKEAIKKLEETRDSEDFKYKTVTEFDAIGNRKKVKRLKTVDELKESTDKINTLIDKSKTELAKLEKQQPSPVSEQGGKDLEGKKADIERRRQDELNNLKAENLSVMASDYLLTGGIGSILSSDYFIQSLLGSFTNASSKISSIRNKYKNEVINKYGNLSDFINTDLYNKMMEEIREAINSSYNTSEAESIFNEILKSPTGVNPKIGNQLSIQLDKINSTTEEINAKYDAELAELEKQQTSPVSEQGNIDTNIEEVTLTDTELTNQKTQQDVQKKEEVQKTQEVKVDEPVEKKTGSTSISQKVRDKIKTYFDKLVGKDTNLITVSTAKLEEIAKSRGFDSFKAMVAGWHGSKENFDKFSTEKIGTGTKAARGGWGLYFTLDRDKARAEGYARSLSKTEITIGDRTVDSHWEQELYDKLLQLIDKYNGSRLSIVKELLKESEQFRQQAIEERNANKAKGLFDEKGNYKNEWDGGYERTLAGKSYDLRDAAKKIIKEGVSKKDYPSYLYKVSLSADNLLDFSKNITDTQYEAILHQAEVENSVYLPAILKNRGKQGRSFYWNVANSVMTTEKELSLLMLRAGIDGNLVYEDATQELVIFDENAITIDEKIRFLSTPSGEIYGLFIEEDDKGEPHIYLDDKFTTGVLLEELKHFQYFTMKMAEKKGDEVAGKIIKEAERILKPIVDKVIVAQGKTESDVKDSTNRNAVLQEIKREYGIDLMSEVYKQQKNETDEAYQDRIFDEVWAKITVAEGEKDIKANYTFWNKVKELLGTIQKWFANSLGLKDQDLSKLTPYELGKQSFNSLMKGEFITAEPIKLNTRERELGVFVDSADEIFARIPQEIQEFLTKQTKWNGVKSIPIPILKRLASRKLSLTEKFLIIGKEVSIFKQELSREQIERFADAEMEGVVSYKDHAELADYYINSIDTANITLSPNTHTDLRVMDRLFHYFMNHKGVDSQRIVVELSVRFDKIASALGGLMWAISPKGSLTAITNEMIIRSHGRMFSDFLGTKTYKEMKAEMDKVVDQLAMTKEELDEVKQKLRKLTDNKTTNKATLIKSGFVQRDEQSAIRKVMNSVGIAKSTSKVPKASAIRFSAEPINDVEEALANLLLTDYLKEGNLLQAKGRYEKQLEQLKNVDGENVYERLVANLPANYDLVNDLAKSKIFTELRSKEDKIAAIAVIEDRILGKKEGEKVISKPIHQRISFDFVDNFIKDLFSRVYPITNITISKQHLDAVNITDIDNPTGKESSEAYVLFEYYDKIKAAVELYNTGKSTLYEMDNEVKKLNAAMQKQLSKFSIFTDIFPSFDIVYEGNSPIDGSVQRFRGNRYVYDGTSKEWNRVNDFRKVPKEIQDKLNVAYLSKAPISEKYLASALDKFKSMVDDPAKSEELEDIIISTYQAFLNRGYNKHHIRDIENMLYNAYGIDVTGVVGIRNLVENDLALFNATLDEVVEDIYSINTAMWNQKGGKLDRTFAGYNSLTEALADRLGIDEYNGIQIEEAVKAFLTHEIYPNKEKALANFKKSASDAVVKESVRLAINGKLSPLDLFPIFASKYNKKIGTPEAFRQYSKLVKDWEDAETNMEKKNARIALQQFFINHKNDGWVKPIFEAIIQYGVVAYFGANVLLVSQLPGIATLPERILMYPAVLTHNMLASKDGRISGKEMKSLLLKVFSSSYVELAGKGIPEILDVLATGKGKVTYMSEDNRLQRETAIDKVLINYINDSIANAYNHIKYGIVNLSPIINMKEGDKETQLFIDKNHPLHNVKTILTDAIRIDPNNAFSIAIDIINEKIAELNSVGRDLYKNERLSKKQYEEAIVFLEANKNYVASSRLLTKAEINKEILKDSKRLATSLVLSAAATLYRAKTFPVIADIITRMIVSPQDVAWETYFQKRKTPNGEGELMKSVLDALGEVKEVDEQLKEEGYGNDILGDLSRRAEIKEGYRGSPVWDLVARSTGQLTQMERTRDVAGLLSNTLSDLINNTQMFDPSRYEGGMKELVGLAWGLTKLTEVIFIPFVLKVGTNVFNFAKYYIPLGLPAMLTLKGGVNIATRLIQRNNINPQDWVIKDGVWVNKSMTITKDPNNIATSYIVSKDNKIIDSYPTLHEAKIMAGKVNNIVLPDGYMKYIDPFKSFRGKLNLEGKGGLVKIEEEFDLSPVDKYKLVFRSLQGTMIFLYMFMQMWDFDEDEKTGKMVAVKRRDSAWELVGNESNNFTADRLIKREPNTLRLDLNKTGLGRLGLKNLPIMQARLADLPFSPALGGLVELENDVYNSQNIYTDEATPKHVFDNSMSAVLGVFRDATIRSMQMAAHQMFFNSLAEFGGLVSSINRYEPVDKNTDGYKADRAIKNMLRKPSQFLLRMAVPNFQKDINSIFGGNVVSSTNKTLKPLADVMNTPQLYILSTADMLYNGVSKKAKSYLSEWVTSELAGTIGIKDILGIQGDFDDNFSYITRSARGSIMKNVPATKSIDIVRLPFDEISEFDKWGIDNGISAAYKYTSESGTKHITTPNDNTKLRKYVDTKATEIVNKIFVDNIDMFNKKLADIPEVAGKYDHGYNIDLKDNTATIREIKQKFNDAIIQKSHDIALVLGIVEMIKLNPDNSALLQENITKKFIPKSWVSDDYSTLDISAFESDPSELSYEYAIDASDKATLEEQLYLSLNTDITINGKTYKNLSVAKLKGVLSNIAGKLNNNDKTFWEKGVLLNSNNKLIAKRY